jgi:Tol biopolymer transport system component
MDACGLGACGFAAEPTGVEGSVWPLGRWRVAERGWGWATRLETLEVRTAGASGDAIAVAYDLDARGRERVWGSARLHRPLAGPAAARWLTAEWIAGGSAVLLQLRLEPRGTLTAVLRERPRDGALAVGERVRQVVLERADHDERLVATAVGRGVEAAPAGPREGLAGLFAVDASGGGLRAIALPDGFGRAAFPAWSPDGRWIAFAAFDASGRDPVIRVVAARGGPTTAVAAGVAPSWSHDASRIVYVASGKPADATDWNAPGRNDERIELVQLVGAAAGEVEVVTRGIWPRWAPDDDRLALVARREANWDVYIRSADGLSLARLTDDPALDTHPIWTGDGRGLIFLSDRGNRWDLYRVAARGGEPATRLTNHRRREDDAALSPDGRAIAFTDRRGRPDSSILVLDLERGSVRRLFDEPDGARDPAWSPDGRTIAFVSRYPSPRAVPPTRPEP